MSRSGTPPRPPGGLTIVELLIVLFIVGLGWFTLLPRLDPTRPSGPEAPLHAMNVFLAQAAETAAQTGRSQVVHLDLVFGGLTWNDATHHMPSPPSHCILNGSPCPHPSTSVRIYPQGHMDRLRLDFSGGARWAVVDLQTRMAATGTGP